MNDIATVASGLDGLLLCLLMVLAPLCLFVSPLADLLTKSYWLLLAKFTVAAAGVMLADVVLPVWFVSAFLGLTAISFIRAFRWFRRPTNIGSTEPKMPNKPWEIDA